MFTEQDIKKVAKLARIKLDQSEITQYQHELSNILLIIDNLQKIEVANIHKMTNVREDAALPMREDKVSDGNIVEEIMKNAPSHEFNCFKVPKVVE